MTTSRSMASNRSKILLKYIFTRTRIIWRHKYYERVLRQKWVSKTESSFICNEPCSCNGESDMKIKWCTYTQKYIWFDCKAMQDTGVHKPNLIVGHDFEGKKTFDANFWFLFMMYQIYIEAHNYCSFLKELRFEFHF